MNNPLLTVPRFTFADSAKAIERSVGTVRTWAARGGFELSPDDRASPQGGIRLMSLRTLYRLAIACELIEFGVAPELAFQGAMVFTDTPSDGRDPGDLFPEGQTMFAFFKPDKTKSEPDFLRTKKVAVVFNVKDDDKFDAAMVPAFFTVWPDRTKQNSFILINVNFICGQVLARLGIEG